MKKYIMSFACILIAITFILTGCSKALFKDGPKSSDPVVGNGGYAVVKGDYLYFTNAFISSSTVGQNKNKYGEESVASIYRTKLTSNGSIALDANNNPVKAEILVKQIGGFENSNLYIFGDYLYYTSPKTLVGSDKTAQTGLVSFNRIKLDGSSQKEIFVSKEILDNYTISEIDGTVYFISYASSKVESTSITEKGKVKSYTLAEDATSYAAKSGNIKNANEKFVYITKTVNLNDDGVISGNKICKIPFTGGDEITLLNRETYALVSVTNNRLYYTISSVLYSNDFAGTLTQYGYNAYNSYKFLSPQNNEDMGMVALITTGEDTNLVYVCPNESSTLTTKVIATKIGSKIEILGLLNQSVVYAIDSTIYVKSIFADDLITITTTANLKVSDTTCFDYDTHNIYLFEYAEDSNSVNYYLHMLKTKDDASKVLIGVLAEADIPKEEEK